ncbi:flagellar biosynthetic protein FliO [Flocculibacter collagenilyticus]|uniref:flagellar biosynthetic protein FliO n=1 Tax=Flocculibacter collagenilyticus TaxID=2744479 RepID=UPI0018F3AFAB|nr:flagellar biosynthetic protein FliO [Flocculibacter collagenilyticus]
MNAVIFLLVSCCLFSPFLMAAEQAQGYTPDYLSAVLSLLLVLCVVVLLASIVKRFNLGMPAGQHMKVVTSLQLGPKERILVVEIQGKQHVLGATGQQINYLLSLDENITANVPQVDMANKFKKLLQQGNHE